MRTRSNHKALMAHYSDLRATYAHARHFHQTCDELIAAKSKNVWQQCGKRTIAEVEFLRGADRVLWDNLWADMVWRLGTEESGPIPEGEKPADYSKVTHGAHFWRGTDKEFTTWESLGGRRPLDSGVGPLTDGKPTDNP